MQFDPVVVGGVLIVAALALVAIFVAAGIKRKRNLELKRRFGAEYERALAQTGSRSEAVKRLEERERLAQSLDIQPLSRDVREQFAREWERIEARFVERPTIAVMEAEEMIQSILRKKGYPISSTDGLLADLSVQQPELVDDYRAARTIIDREDPSELNTEELRKAMLNYRNLFDRLVGSVPRFQGTGEDVEIPHGGVAPGRRATDPSIQERDRRNDRVIEEHRPRIVR